MQVYKVVLPYGGKRFYESKKEFDRYWPNNLKRAKFGAVVAFKIDWKEHDWKCIRRIGPNINYYSE